MNQVAVSLVHSMDVLGKLSLLLQVHRRHACKLHASGGPLPFNTLRCSFLVLPLTQLQHAFNTLSESTATELHTLLPMPPPT